MATTSETARVTLPSASPRHRDDIQGMRAIAVIAVVLYHAGLPVPGGFVGVDVFFVVSGFVIASMLRRDRDTVGGVDLRRFYVRRFRRLTPALAAMVSITLVLSALFLSPLGGHQTTAKTATGAMLLSANRVIAKTTGGYFDAAAELNPLLHTWSLSVEEQFYLVFPVLLLGFWRITARRRDLVQNVGLAILGAASLIFMLRGVDRAGIEGSSWLIGFYSPLTRAWEFLAGVLLAQADLSRIQARLGRKFATIVGCAGLGLLVISIFEIDASTPFPSSWTILPVAATLLLLVSGSARGSAVSRALSVPALTRIGDWSYSIYLWHWPFIVFARILWPHPGSAVLMSAALLSLVPALLSYRWIEQPIRAASNSGRSRFVALVVVCLAVPLALAWALRSTADHAFWSSRITSFQAALFERTVGSRENCDEFKSPDQMAPGQCKWNETSTLPPIYLVGDSNANHFSDGVVAAGTELGRPVEVATSHACPLVDISFRWTTKSNRWNRSCADFVASTMSYLDSARPGVVVISNIDWYWYSDQIAAGLDSEHTSTSQAEKFSTLRAGLSSTIRRLQQAGHRVVLVQTIPTYGDSTSPSVLPQFGNWYPYDPRACPTITVLNGNCAQSMPVDDALRHQGEVRETLKTVATSENASLWDPWPLMCDATTCSTERDGTVLYRDAAHITADESQAMTPELRAVIEAAG